MKDAHHVSDCAHRVLAAAMEVFGEEGYGASINAVSQRAGVARQTIYNNFGNKRQLFDEALRHSVVNLFSVLETTDGPLEERLFRFGLRFREVVLSVKNLRMYRLMICEAPRFPKLAAGFHEIFAAHGRRRISEIIESAMNDNLLRREDADETAQVFLDMLVSAETTRRLLGGKAAHASAASETRHTRRIVAAFLRAHAVPVVNAQPASSPEGRSLS